MPRGHRASQSEEQAAQLIVYKDDPSLAEWHMLEEVVASQDKAGESPAASQVVPSQPDLDMELDMRQDGTNLGDANTMLYDATRSLHFACKKAMPMRQAATLLRSKMDHATADYQYAQNRVRDSQQALFDKITVILQTLRDQEVEGTDCLHELYETMIGETAALEMKVKTLADCGASASRAESALAEQDERVSQESRKVLEALTSTASFAKNDDLIETVPEGTFETVPVEVINGSALAYYYSSKADAEIMAEREHSLNFDYQEELAVRTFRQDHDDILSITDEEFELAYKADFEDARKDYEEALATMKAAYKACQTLGILIEEQTDTAMTTPEPSIDGIAFDAPLPFPLQAHIELPRIYSQPLLRRTSSPTLCSVAAGSVLSDPNPRTRSRAEYAHKNAAAVEHWLRTTSVASQSGSESVVDTRLSPEHPNQQATTNSDQESNGQEPAPKSDNSAPATPRAVELLEQPTVARVATPDGGVGNESSTALEAAVA